MHFDIPGDETQQPVYVMKGLKNSPARIHEAESPFAPFPAPTAVVDSGEAVRCME
jgi:hypothetical protein